MTLKASVIQDVIQKNGYRKVRYRYTEATSGEIHEVGPVLLAPGVDAQVDANQRLAFLEDKLIADDLRVALDQCTEGANPDTVPLRYASRDALRFRVIASLLNRCRDEHQEPDKFYAIVNSLDKIDNYSDAQVAAIVGWTEAEIASLRATLKQLASAISNLDHGKPEIELDA